MENVFIAWSGNRELAELVAARLRKNNLNPLIGGGLPRDMFVGSHVMSQMDSCNYAIILAQKKEEYQASAEFSDNVMFEWGYLIAKLSNRKVFVFLIDTSERDLPSDLVGSWIQPVSRKGRPDEEVADEIAAQFVVERPSADKIEILSKWRLIKNVLLGYNTQHRYTDFEIAQFVLYSVFSAFYCDDIDAYVGVCGGVETTSKSLNAILSLTRNKMQIYQCTANLARPLQVEDFFEITTMLQYRYEDAVEESDLKAWAKIIRIDALSLANALMASNSAGDERAFYHREAIRLGDEVLGLIDENVERQPNNLHFADLLRGLQYRNIAMAYEDLGEADAAKEYFGKSVEARESLYFFYKQSHAPDASLCNKMAQEYYLAQLERCAFEVDPLEKQRILMTVKKHLTAWEADFVRQKSLLQMVKDAYEHAQRQS